MHAIGQQRRGQGVAGTAEIIDAVELETDVRAALDPPARLGAHAVGQQPALEHAPDQQTLHHALVAR